MTMGQQFDGSRRHVLDWVESPAFLDTIRAWVREEGFVIPDDSIWMPKSWAEPMESKLFDAASPFLSDEQKDELRSWWLVYARAANIPNWDLIVSAFAQSAKPALLLVEAKAHVGEFDCFPKKRMRRADPAAQRRTDDNHERIGRAIDEASKALSRRYPGISISRDKCYQFSNRVAFAWKLASMGIPVALIYLGFCGDSEIHESYFQNDAHWQSEFGGYARTMFPVELIGQQIDCGYAAFSLQARSLPVASQSSPLSARRRS